MEKQHMGVLHINSRKISRFFVLITCTMRCSSVTFAAFNAKGTKTRTKLTELSPFLGAEAFLGNRMSLERYSFRRCTLACSDSVDLLRRRGSTEMPIVRAVFLWMPAACRDDREINIRMSRGCGIQQNV